MLLESNLSKLMVMVMVMAMVMIMVMAMVMIMVMAMVMIMVMVMVMIMVMVVAMSMMIVVEPLLSLFINFFTVHVFFWYTIFLIRTLRFWKLARLWLALLK